MLPDISKLTHRLQNIEPVQRTVPAIAWTPRATENHEYYIIIYNNNRSNNNTNNIIRLRMPSRQLASHAMPPGYRHHSIEGGTRGRSLGLCFRCVPAAAYRQGARPAEAETEEKETDTGAIPKGSKQARLLKLRSRGRP